jgi:hypothetical protein
MHWLLQAGFIIAHLLAYIAVFRYWRAFTAERTIVIYHGLAFTAVFVVVFVAFARGAIGFAASCGLLAVQYLYSLSFLELWTLAEGSYSLQILLRVSRQPSISREEIIATYEAIGADKKRNRLDDLHSLKLIEKSPDGTFELSAIPIRGFRTKCFRSPRAEIGHTTRPPSGPPGRIALMISRSNCSHDFRVARFPGSQIESKIEHTRMIDPLMPWIMRCFLPQPLLNRVFCHAFALCISSARKGDNSQAYRLVGA